MSLTPGSTTAKTKTGYEIPFNRHFYVFTPPRPLNEIDADLKQVTDQMLDMIGGLKSVHEPAKNIKDK